MWTAARVIALRRRFGVDRTEFARILGVDARSVARWEAGHAQPSGSSEAVLNALREQLDSDPANAERVVEFVVKAAAIGGLAYLMVKLLKSATQ